MFRFFVIALAAVGLFSLLSGALGTAAAGVSALVLLPILLFKLFFILMIFSFFGRRMWGRDGGSRRWRSPGRAGPERSGRSGEDRFEEWHGIAHAREEVDSWIDGMPDAGRE